MTNVVIRSGTSGRTMTWEGQCDSGGCEIVELGCICHEYRNPAGVACLKCNIQAFWDDDFRCLEGQCNEAANPVAPDPTLEEDLAGWLRGEIPKDRANEIRDRLRAWWETAGPGRDRVTAVEFCAAAVRALRETR